MFEFGQFQQIALVSWSPNVHGLKHVPDRLGAFSANRAIPLPQSSVLVAKRPVDREKGRTCSSSKCLLQEGRQVRHVSGCTRLSQERESVDARVHRRRDCVRACVRTRMYRKSRRVTCDTRAPPDLIPVYRASPFSDDKTFTLTMDPRIGNG
jgi:hypothetical protein